MTNTEEQEIWKTYPEYPFIQASNLGRVRTVDRVITRSNGRKQFVKGKVLRQHYDRYGYLYVRINMNGKRFCRKVHRIIASSFIPNPNNYPEVNHIDNNRTNNVVSNLEWCTTQYNTAYKEKYGVPAKESTKILRKPVIAVDLNSFKVLWFESQSEAERQLGFDSSNITRVIKERYKKTHGYWFTYADENAVEKIRAKFDDDIAEKVEKLINEHRN